MHGIIITNDCLVRQLSQENEILYQKLMATSRKLEHAEAEFAQSREYFEAQLDISHAREFKLNEQNRRCISMILLIM